MASALESSTAPRLGGKSAFVLFVVVLLAFVVETQLTQYLQTTLGYKQSYFIFYLVHSCFSFSLPIHLVYLLSTTEYELRPLLSGLRFAVMRQLSATPEHHESIHNRKKFIVKNTFLIGAIAIFYNLPGLLWFAAVPLAPVTDVTAIWNASAFFTYVLSVKMLGMKWEVLRLLAVCLATLGVVTVVYGGTTAPTPGADSISTSSVYKPSPFVGDMLTLAAALTYAFYQVIYKKYIALPTDPELTADSIHYRRLSSGDNSAEEEIPTPVLLKDEMVYPPPFGLHPNLVTTSIGICTLLVLWIPIPILHYYHLEEFRLPASRDVLMAIAGIAASGVLFNAGFMVRPLRALHLIS
ncbi:hypothetical protein ID866_2422 [Astraeus odoratus]|nr:hypothetical protein ID866_2422 [Astraeus odoratus]